MNDVVFYKVFDIFCTLNECVCLHLFLQMLTDKDIRNKRNIGTGLWFMFITILGTYTITSIPLKSISITIFFGIGWSILNKISILKAVALVGISFGWTVCIQGSVNFFTTFFLVTTSFDMGDFLIGTWQYTLVMQVILISLTAIIYNILRNFYFKWEKRDLLLVGCLGITEGTITVKFVSELIEGGVQHREGLFFCIFFFFITLLLIKKLYKFMIIFS